MSGQAKRRGLALAARSVANTEDAGWLEVLAGLPSAQIDVLAARGLGRTAVLLLQNACESRCFFCASPGTTEMPASEVTSRARVDTWIDDARRLDLDRVCIGGTEPALHPSFAHALGAISAMSSAPIEVMTSALRLASPGMARRWHDLGVRAIAAPIYAARAIVHDEVVGRSGAHAELCRGLDEAYAAGIEVHLHTLALRRTLAELPSLAQLTRDRWRARLAIGPARPKAGVWRWDEGAASSEELRLATTELDITLVGFPRCLMIGKPHAAARVIDAYFRSTKTSFAPECEPCGERDRCVGVVPDELARGTRVTPFRRPP